MNWTWKDTLAVTLGLLCFVVLPFATGCAFTATYYKEEIAEIKKADAEALAAAKAKTAEGLSNATNTINVAQAEYDRLSSELDRARARLRLATAGPRAEGSDDSADALRARVAKLESVVQQMADAGSECGRLFEHSARQHDALADAVK